MVSCVYVTATEPRSGKSVVSLGMFELLAARLGRVGYFRPVVTEDPDPQIELLRRRYDIEAPSERLRGVTAAGRLRACVEDRSRRARWVS